MIKEIHYTGYTTEPSDYECPDGALATSLNLISEDNQLKPLFAPAVKFSLAAGEQLLWLHKMNGHTHYILLNQGALYWLCEQNGEQDASPLTRHAIPGGTVSGTPTLNSIGNTLILNDDNGVNYFLWSDSTYTALGQKPPMLEIVFGLHSEFAVWPDKKNTGAAVKNFKGVDIQVGKLRDTILPRLGTKSEEPDSAAWARPKAVMQGYTGTDDFADRIREFGNNHTTYSTEDMTSLEDAETRDLALIKNRLSNGVYAAINKLVNDLGTNKNKFVMPFFIRYACRLYDGSYILHSYPVLMIPNSRGPIFGLDGWTGLMLADYSDHIVGFRMRGRAYGFLASLVYSINSIPPELLLWKDIITSIDIGVSAPVFTYDQAGSVYGWTNMDDNSAWDEYYTISKVVKLGDQPVANPSWGGIRPFKTVFQNFDYATHQVTGDYGDYFNHYTNNGTTYSYPSYIATVPQRNISDINNDLTGATSFYVIKQLALDELSAPLVEQSLNLDEGTLSGLRGRKTIDDDYRSHDTLAASLIYNYNGRINFANVERTPHPPINPAVQFTQANSAFNSSGSAWQVAVSLKNDAQELTVRSDIGYNALDFPRWIFYPDTNAKFAYVTKNGTTYRVKLTPHDYLNGAYWLGNIMTQDQLASIQRGSLPTIVPDSFHERNKLYTSNVNNPFVFAPDNINTIGTGNILGICSAAKALSQGQFGQFPLYAFTDEGVWALEVSGSGSFSARQPITRDVVINPNGITQIDSSVLFVTARGIMQLSGSTAQCISDDIFAEQPFNVLDLPHLDRLHAAISATTDNCMPVQPFLDFLDGCQMVYDYVHQRIVVFNPATLTTAGATTPRFEYAYVYSLKSHAWGMLHSNLDYAVNSYPDAMAVDKQGHLVTFSDTDDTISHGLFVTRPLKLDAPDVHKTVSTIIQRGHFVRGDVNTVLYGSRDLYNWHLVWSSRDHFLRGFRGTPYKYFRIAGNTAFDRAKSLFGASLNFEHKHTNNLR